MAGEGVGFAAVDPKVLIQPVLVPEGFATVGALVRAEALPDEEVLQCCILRRERKMRNDYQRGVYRQWIIRSILLRLRERLTDAMECHKNVYTMKNDKRNL